MPIFELDLSISPTEVDETNEEEKFQFVICLQMIFQRVAAFPEIMLLRIIIYSMRIQISNQFAKRLRNTHPDESQSESLLFLLSLLLKKNLSLTYPLLLKQKIQMNRSISGNQPLKKMIMGQEK